jgi:lipopolysaccharide transport protein LptA
MRKTAVFAVMALLGTSAEPRAQSAVSPVPSIGSERKSGGEKKGKDSAQTAKSMESKALDSTAPTITEIYADEAFFDSNKSMGVFSGHVKVIDPRFNLQSEKLTVFISKGENQGLQKAIAEGDVGLVRDRPDPNGGPPTRAVGRSEKATYIAATGDVELTGMPRVQQGLNTHIATSSETVMVVNQNGQLTTHGPSRTEIRQQPKEEQTGEGKPTVSPKASAKP